MKKLIILISVYSLVGVPFIFAEPPTEALTREAAPQTYQDFKQLLASDCDASDKKWMNSSEGGSLAVPPEYPELDIGKVNSHILSVIAADKKGVLATELDPTRIGEFSGLKSLEIARIEYRNTMDDLFACAVIDSRIQILKDLQTKINAKFPTPNDEIKIKLENESKRLTAFRSSMTDSCTSPKESTIPIETQIKNTATRQFCHFEHYLVYLKDNMEKDNSRFMQIESGIGSWGGTKQAKTTEEFVQELAKRQNQIQSEIARAKNTLPRAVRAFQEMKRTYPLHIMLTILFDDYLRFRENLNRYFNANSQLFEKMDNAQDANAR